MADDKGSLVLGIMIFTLILGGLVILARLVTRTVIKPLLGMDDLMITITWFIILAYNVATFVAISRGYGKHIDVLSAEQIASAQEAEVIAQFLAIYSFPTGKAAVAYLLMRLFPPRRLKFFLWFFVIINAVFFYLDGLFILIQCQPVAFQWNRNIPGGSCWNSVIVINWGYLTGVTGAFTDLVFALVPWWYIWGLNMRLQEKITIGVGLSLGLFPFACAILKIYYTSTLGAHADFTYDTVPLFLWSSAELCAINVAACVPTLRPLYLWLRGRDVNGVNPNIRPEGYTPGRPTQGSRFRRSGLLSHRADRGTQLASVDSDGKYIHQLRTYDVRVEDRNAILGDVDARGVNTTTTTVTANDLVRAV